MSKEKNDSWIWKNKTVYTTDSLFREHLCVVYSVIFQLIFYLLYSPTVVSPPSFLLFPSPTSPLPPSTPASIQTGIALPRMSAKHGITS